MTYSPEGDHPVSNSAPPHTLKVERIDYDAPVPPGAPAERTNHRPRGLSADNGQLYSRWLTQGWTYHLHHTPDGWDVSAPGWDKQDEHGDDLSYRLYNGAGFITVTELAGVHPASAWVSLDPDRRYALEFTDRHELVLTEDPEESEDDDSEDGA